MEEKDYIKSSDGICLLLDNPDTLEELQELNQKVQAIIEEFQLQEEEEEDVDELKRKIDEGNDQQ